MFRRSCCISGRRCRDACTARGAGSGVPAVTPVPGAPVTAGHDRAISDIVAVLVLNMITGWPVKATSTLLTPEGWPVMVKIKAAPGCIVKAPEVAVWPLLVKVIGESIKPWYSQIA